MLRGKLENGAGQFNQLVTVQQLKSTITEDAAGHIDETDTANWETYCERWAKLITRGSREFLVGDQQAATANPSVRMRSDSKTREITTAMRLLVKGRVCSISEPPQDVGEEREFVEFGYVEVKS